MKFCHKCSSLKPLDAFNKCKGKKDGLESKCRDCKKQYYLNNKQNILNQVKERYEEKREEIIKKKNERYAVNKKNISDIRKKKRRENPGAEALTQKKRFYAIRIQVLSLLGSKCASCGCNDLRSLCIDHINNDGSDDRKKYKSAITLMRNIIKNGNTNEYQCLCFNCNLRKEVLKERYFELQNESKKCPTCLNILDISSFKVHGNKVDGRYYECRKCLKFRNLILKYEALKKLGADRCSCGVNDLLVLSVDHINEDGHNFRSDGLGVKLYRSIVNGSIDISNLQVKCMNCNLNKHFIFKKYYEEPDPHYFSVEKPLSVPNGAPTGKIRSDIPSNNELVDFSFADVTFVTLNDIEIPRTFLDSYHYAGFGRGGTVTYGVFLASELLAVVKFAPPIRQGVANTLGVQRNELLELDRFCIHPARHKKNFASFIMKRVIRQVKTDFPHVRKLVSFADPHAGHSGHIYKASNWTYDGKTSSSYYYEDRDGNAVNKKTLYQWAKKHGMKERECFEALGYARISIPAKFKYHYSF